MNQAVFLSYASEDADAARCLCEALRAAGIEVWFDKSELRGGDAWDASIRRQIKECALFVPLISANTDARSEGYFRREWNLAVSRMLDMSEDQAFLVPVAIDDTAEATARVPDRFRERQWLRLRNGEASPDFVARVSRLIGNVPTPAPSPMGTSPRIDPGATSPRRRASRLTLAVLSVVVIASAVAIYLWNGRDSRGPPPVQTAAPSAPAPAPDRKSIAVLPFENLSDRVEDAYLADGLHEEVLNAVARLRDLKVISRTSVMEYRGKAHNVREIGKRLGVGTILEGSIRRDGNTLRLTVQLIDAHTDRHLLAVNYDRDLAHVLDLQSAVARRIAEALSSTLSQAERDKLYRVATNSGDAYDRYLRAVALYGRPVPNDVRGVVEPKRLLGEALRFDSDYADALALLSRANIWIFFFNRRPEEAAAASQAFERALAIDPQLPEARLARGLYSMYVARNLGQALADLESVVSSRPSAAEAHHALGLALRRRGRTQEALEHFQRAWDLDPLNETYSFDPVMTLQGLRRLPEALEQIRIYSERFPNDPRPYFVRARAEGYLQHSVEPLRSALRDHGNQLDARSRKVIEAEIGRAEGRYLDAARILEAVPAEDRLTRSEQLGFLYHAAGDTARAQRHFRDIERDGIARFKRNPELVLVNDFMPRLALAQSMLGQHAAAVATIEAARAKTPEALDAINGPRVSFARSIVLVRAGRSDEGYAEVKRLLRVPFGAPIEIIFGDPAPELLLVKDDPHYDELINHPPRL